MANRKNHLGRWVACAVLLLCGVLFVALSVSVADALPRVSEYRRNRFSEGVTFGDCERMPQVSFTDNLALCAEPGPEATERFGEVMPSLVNGHYFDVYQIRVNGSAITEQHVSARTAVAVISDSAAHKISLDGNVIGQSFSMWGKEFVIVGVYQTPKGFLHRSALDGFDRVYLPYTCFGGFLDFPVDTAAAPKDSYSEKALPLLGMKPAEPAFYLENDIGVKRAVIANSINFLVSFIALMLLIAAVRIIIEMGRRAAQRLRTAGQTEYLFGVLRNNRLYLLSRILFSLALIAVPVTLLFLFPPQPVLPSEYIPYDNIFDLPYYLNVFITRVQRANAGLAAGNGYYQHLFDHTVLLLIPAFLLLAVLSAAAVTGISRRICDNIKQSCR